MDRRRRMGCLFANLAEHGISEAQRHGWASGVLNREVKSFTSLTVEEIDGLIYELNRPSSNEYVMCGEEGPDGLLCVHDVAHLDHGWPCVDEYGREWVSV